MTIVEFLLARIDEEETEAQRLVVRFNATTMLPLREVAEMTEGDVIGMDKGDMTQEFQVWAAEQSETKDPRRLSECLARRALVRLHDQGGERLVGFPRADRTEAYCLHDQKPAPCPTLRHLAAVYADHPNYREEWAP